MTPSPTEGASARDGADRPSPGAGVRTGDDLLGLLDAVHEPLLVLDGGLRVRSVNRPFSEAFGVAPAEAEGRLVRELGGPGWDDPGLRALLERVATGGPPGEALAVEGEFAGVGRKSLRVSARGVHGPGHPGGLVLLAIEDVTGRRWVEAERLRLVERYEAVLSNTPDLVYVFDLDHRFTYANKALLEIWGRTWDEAIGKNCLELGYPDWHAAMHDREIEEVVATGRPIRGEVAFTGTKGRRVYDYIFVPVIGPTGGVEAVAGTTRDVTDRRRSDEVSQTLAAIVASSDDAIISKALDGTITSWNRGAERIFGYTADEMIGRHISMLMPPEKAEDMERILGRIRRGERVDHYETRRRAKDGRILDISVSVSPIRDARGTIVGASKVARDITDRKRAEEERERLLAVAQAARAEAEAANRTKDDFLATLSHELRTPLNAIVGWSRILRSGNVDPVDLEEGLAAIERNGQVQAQLIEDLLDISRITAGNLKLNVQRVDIAEVIEAALAAVSPAAQAKGLRIHKVFDSLVGPVTGDPARLQQIVWNLLSNAVKFTPKGGRIQVLLERVNSHIEISVVDTGMGIRPEFLPHVFERFRQADSSTTRRYGGLGLGLAIVKQLAEMHGGGIRAKSPGEGQGATFTVSLPIAVVHPEPEKVRPRDRGPEEAEAGRDGVLAGLKVLVVDDEPDARQVIRRVLVGCRAEVAVASAADEAMALVESDRPDVLVSDIGLPDEDGYDLIRRVRAVYSGRDLPAAALTAFARTEDRKRALLAGFQTHIAKPVDPVELTAAVASLAGRTGRAD
jgi:PAS domain S-box-containing protein